MTSPIALVLDPPGADFLAEWDARPERHSMSAFEFNAALRAQGASPEVAAAVITQCELRDRAEAKLGPLARRLIFTRDGIEQATRLTVAAAHAQRFSASGARLVADLGCGNGSDSLAFLMAGLHVLAVDIAPDAATAARWNLQVISKELSTPSLPLLSETFLPRDDRAKVIEADVTTLDMAALTEHGVDAIFADPARRTGAAKGAARVLSPDQWSPSLPTVLSWRNSFERIGIKLAPGIDHAALPADCHAQWTSIDGDLVETALWTPALAPEGGGRSALVIRGEEKHVLSDPQIHEADAPVPQTPIGELGGMIAEPDPAVIRSGSVRILAERLGAHLISDKIAYLSGDAMPATPFASRFEVREVVALRPKAIAAALRALDVGRVEVKKRGVDLDPASLRSALKLSGTQEATVIATRIAGRHRAIIARRVRD